MKYQVGFVYRWEGEMSVEAESIDEAKEIVKDEVFSDPWDNASGNFELWLNEVYEWDEEAQKQAQLNIEEIFKAQDEVKSNE